MKIVYIILAHKLPEQLVRLVRRLSADETSFLVHVDRKTDYAIYRRMTDPLNSYQNVHFLERHLCNWGDFGHVEATLDGLRVILEMNLGCDYVILLTGQDYPIKPNNHIRDYLNASNENSFIEYFALPSDRWKSESGGLDRLTYWHFNWRGRRFALRKKGEFRYPLLARLWLHLADKPPIRRSLPKSTSVFGGSAYWCLTRDCIEYVDGFVRKNPRFVNFFRHVLLPEEIFFQTVILNSDFRNRIVNDSLRYIAWSRSPHPAILSDQDFESLISAPKLFARKFDMTINSNILDMID